MRKQGIFFTIFIFFFLTSCGPDEPASDDNTEAPSQASEDSVDKSAMPEIISSCKPAAKVLDGNSLLVRERGLAVFIAADSSTYDSNLGDSHRLLITMDMVKCEEIDRQLLPMNISADFPYRLADISYHRLRKLIAIKGLKTVLCYDLMKKTILGPVYPQYKNEREYADAQTGNIQRLEIWEDYIMGYATDLGAFAFLMEDDNIIRPYLPVIEYSGDGLAEGALFLIPTTDDKVQAIIPGMEDQPPYGFSIETLFEQPIELKGTPQKILSTYVILGKTSAGDQVLVDLKRKKRVDLPESLKRGTVEQIEKWIKENR